MTREEKINALIPAAEKEADKKVAKLGKESEVCQGMDGKPFNWSFWTQFYHAAMNRMAIKDGIRCQMK